MKTKFVQKNFTGGINQRSDSTRIEQNEYPLLVNARNRYDVIEPVNLPDLIVDPIFPLNGKYQGCYSAENILIVFINGQAFWKDFSRPNSYFAKIANFELLPTADIIYATLVPRSYINYVRIPIAEDNIVNTGVNLSSPSDPSPQGLVVQDGLSQPWFIDTDLTARKLQNYSQWDVNGIREYVPVGQQMLFHSGVLYIVASSGRELYRSVTGRPLDFMINILPITGDKMASETEGGASSVSHSVDFDRIISLSALNLDDGSFFVATERSSYAVQPDFEEVIFGEPTFINRFLFSAGCVSPFGVVEMLGDYAFMDFNGLRSFNAILQLKNEGRNSPFSKQLGPILQGIQQDYVAAINFDNYALFACNTLYGRGIIIYDTLHTNFSAVDLYEGIGQIRQFAEIKTTTGKQLFAITQTGLYEIFASETIAMAGLYIGDWASNDPEVDQNPSLLKVVFIDAENSGTVNASCYVDRKLNKTLPAALNLTNSEQLTPPIEPPFGQSNKDTVQTLNFDFGRSLQGWKIGFYVEWDFRAKISHIALISRTSANTNSLESQAKSYARNLEALNEN